jgi:2-polyprenyl-3-methyl-5-hydroxy-6-metoxy-1,4-benzoquinol methylase
MTGPRRGWWDSYFDERFIELYEPFLPEEETKREVGAVLEILGLPRAARLLDLGCGWGRHAIELARGGLRVTGLDLAAPLLAEARRRADGSGATVDWVRGDMRARLGGARIRRGSGGEPGMAALARGNGRGH